MSSVVTLQVPFESIVEAVKSLSLEDQRKLADILDDAIFEAEADLEDDPEVLAEVEEARKDYREGNYVVIDDSLIALFGSIHSDIPDLAENHDRYLGEAIDE